MRGQTQYIGFGMQTVGYTVVCNLIYLYGCFDSKIKIIWLWLLSVWCIFWLSKCLLMPLLLLAHTVSAVRHVEDM